MPFFLGHLEEWLFWLEGFFRCGTGIAVVGTDELTAVAAVDVGGDPS